MTSRQKATAKVTKVKGQATTDQPSVTVSGDDPQDPISALDFAPLTLALVLVANLFHSHAPEPYMDEPFHIPQTRKYCQLEFSEWDPKITTFPGLYIVGAAAGVAFQTLMESMAPSTSLAKVPLCDTTVLRCVNIGFALACFWLARNLHRHVHPEAEFNVAVQMGLLVVLLPTNFFYVFLYYTDIGSLAFVLASLLAAMQRRYFVSALAAAGGVSFRQTNAVWAVFTIVVVLLQRLFRRTASHDRRPNLFKQIFSALKLCWLNRKWVLSQLWPMLTVPLAFACFVICNRGIVVGDRSNHTPQLHLVQPLYFTLFATGMLAQIHFHPARLADAFWQATQALRRKPGVVLKPLGMVFVLCGYLVHNYTLVHPFLLADNRHYIFYLWKDVVAPYPAAKFCLIPLYLYSGWSLRQSLREGGQVDLWIAALGVCTAATLAPAWLLELRYFTIPFVLVALHMKPPTQSQMLHTLGIFAVVNIVTIYMFLYRPFKWPDGSTARFMW